MRLCIGELPGDALSECAGECAGCRWPPPDSAMAPPLRPPGHEGTGEYDRTTLAGTGEASRPGRPRTGDAGEGRCWRGAARGPVRAVPADSTASGSFSPAGAAKEGPCERSGTWLRACMTALPPRDPSEVLTTISGAYEMEPRLSRSSCSTSWAICCAATARCTSASAASPPRGLLWVLSRSSWSCSLAAPGSCASVLLTLWTMSFRLNLKLFDALSVADSAHGGDLEREGAWAGKPADCTEAGGVSCAEALDGADEAHAARRP
mmetsp:Transcript_51938/g.153117  ORF Transcript_51938/g.153117 Transcript_51938/m.153117 type:complete len:264 (-) Transcript_51938:390-1181(-)